jgi:hypothetical protein
VALCEHRIPQILWFRIIFLRSCGNGNGTFQNSAPGRLRAVGPPQFGVPGRRFRSLQKEPCPRPERLNTNSKQTSTPVGLFGRVGVELRRTVGCIPNYQSQAPQNQCLTGTFSLSDMPSRIKRVASTSSFLTESKLPAPCIHQNGRQEATLL